MDEMIPVNRVRAAEIQRELTHEFSKDAWRKAIEAARTRWLLEGHRVERVVARERVSRAGYYIE